jgi:hypothetical protein
VVINHFGANPTEQDMIAILDACAELAGGKPFFQLVDLTKVDTLTPAVRRVIGDSAKHMQFRGLAMFGASFQMKVVAKLVNSALVLFRKSPFPQDFFDTQDQALAWVDQMRARAGAA